jgi:hypothetical protein
MDHTPSLFNKYKVEATVLGWGVERIYTQVQNVEILNTLWLKVGRAQNDSNLIANDKTRGGNILHQIQTCNSQI